MLRRDFEDCEVVGDSGVVERHEEENPRESAAGSSRNSIPTD